jgi:hypothetical protein
MLVCHPRPSEQGFPCSIFEEDEGLKNFAKSAIARLIFGALCALALTLAFAGSTHSASAATVAASGGACYNLSNGYVDHSYFPYGYANGPDGFVGYGYTYAPGYPFNDYWVYSCVSTPGFSGPGSTLWNS